MRKQARLVRGVAALLLLAAALSLLSACSLSDLAAGGPGEADAVLGSGTRVLRILSGSENAELEPILEEAMIAGIVVMTLDSSTQENTLFDMEAVQDVAYGG